jgi:DNA-binding transcriptional regulator LsrR (DeoR family)
VADASTHRLVASDDDRLRLATKIARLYYERGLTQVEIATTLHVSQSRISRLLKFARSVGIARTTVLPPNGVYPELEDQLQHTYGLREAVVVDVSGGTEEVTAALGAAAASYLESTLTGGDTIGISSWSASLLATVESMRPFTVPVADVVVQLVGGVGDPRVQMEATRLLGAFAASTGAEPVFLPTPSLLATASAREALSVDSTVTDVMRQWTRMTAVLVGIGALTPSPLLLESGNALSSHDQAELLDAGAVGDICLRFFDDDGRSVESSLDGRVIGVDSGSLLSVDRRIAVAGGRQKWPAIRASLRGGWVTVLVTDVETATYLMASCAATD